MMEMVVRIVVVWCCFVSRVFECTQCDTICDFGSWLCAQSDVSGPFRFLMGSTLYVKTVVLEDEGRNGGARVLG